MLGTSLNADTLSAFYRRGMTAKGGQGSHSLWDARPVSDQAVLTPIVILTTTMCCLQPLLGICTGFLFIFIPRFHLLVFLPLLVLWIICALCAGRVSYFAHHCIPCSQRGPDLQIWWPSVTLFFFHFPLMLLSVVLLVRPDNVLENAGKAPAQSLQKGSRYARAVGPRYSQIPSFVNLPARCSRSHTRSERWQFWVSWCSCSRLRSNTLPALSRLSGLGKQKSFFTLFNATFLHLGAFLWGFGFVLFFCCWWWWVFFVVVCLFWGFLFFFFWWFCCLKWPSRRSAGVLCSVFKFKKPMLCLPEKTSIR